MGQVCSVANAVPKNVPWEKFQDLSELQLGGKS